MHAKHTARPLVATKPRCWNPLRVRFGLDQATGRETANNTKHANAGCSDIASGLASWRCRRPLACFALFAVSLALPCLALIRSTEGNRLEKQRATGCLSKKSLIRLAVQI